MIDAERTDPDLPGGRLAPSSDTEATDSASAADETPMELRSGLANPQRAIAGLGACILALEALALLLAIVPLRMLELRYPGVAIGVVLVLVVVCVVLARMIRRPWAWHAASVVQLILLAGGFLHWALAGVGLVFGATWCFAFLVRRKLSRPPVRDEI